MQWSSPDWLKVSTLQHTFSSVYSLVLLLSHWKCIYVDKITARLRKLCISTKLDDVFHGCACVESCNVMHDALQ